MKVSSKKLAMGMVMLCLVFSAAYGCGDSNNVVSFTINPTGPTVVLRGGTLQFDTNPTGLLSVSWSVVGGNANGTIDSDGLYTAPSTIPIDNVVTIEADRFGFTAQATVNLQAADTLAFDSPEQVNDNPVPFGLAAFALITGVSNQIGAGSGSLHVYSSWTSGSLPGPVTNVAFASALDLAAFGPEVPLTATNTSANLHLFVDQNQNPGIFFAPFSGGALNFLSSTNQGATFNTAVPVVSPPSGNTEFMPSGQADAANNYHLAYSEGAANNVVNYSTSTNQGATWSAPLPVAVSANDQLYPQIAVSPDGQDIVICYTDGAFFGDSNIFLAISNNGGTSFTASNITNSPAGTANFFCDVVLGPNGEIFLTYNQDEGVDSDIFLQSSTNGGTSFNPPVPVNSSTGGDQALPFMSVDDQGRIDVVWSDGAQIMYSRSIDDGATFATNIPIVPLSAATGVLPMGSVHDSAGRLHVQYLSDVDDPGNNYDIFYLNAE